MKVFRAIDAGMLKAQEYICVITGIVMVLLIVAAAFMRWVLNINFSGSEEIIMFCAFWFYFMGSSAAAYEDSHITADMSNLFIKKEKTLLVVRTIKYFFSAAISIVGTVWSYNFLIWYLERNPRSPIYKLPEVFMVLPVFISFVLMSLYLLRYFIKEIARAKEVFTK